MHTRQTVDQIAFLACPVYVYVLKSIVRLHLPVGHHYTSRHNMFIPLQEGLDVLCSLCQNGELAKMSGKISACRQKRKIQCCASLILTGQTK